MVEVSLLFCIVFDHLMTMESWENIKSPLQSCLVASKFLVVWGKMLERRRKEKKERRYIAL